MKPIETRYNGYRFRSRLEARWAVYFDALGIRYEYEPEGYKLLNGWYLPDFYLPQWGAFAEVKPVSDYADATETLVHLAFDVKHAAILLTGIPGQEWCAAIGGPPEHVVGFANLALSLATGDFRIEREPTPIPLNVRLLHEAAVDEAKGARFEHGESPTVRRLTLLPHIPAGTTKPEVYRMMEAAGYR